MNNLLLLNFPAGGAQSMSSLVMILLMVAVFYFFIVMPGRKRQKQEESMRSNLAEGDKVVTVGGICGAVSYVKRNEDGKTLEVVLKVDESTKITFKKEAIARVLDKNGEEISADGKKSKK